MLVAVPYPAEYLPPPPGPGVLGEVAAQTGGSLIGPADYGVLQEGRTELWPWLVGLALLLFAVSVCGRMLARRGPVGEDGAAADGSGAVDEPAVGAGVGGADSSRDIA